MEATSKPIRKRKRKLNATLDFIPHDIWLASESGSESMPGPIVAYWETLPSLITIGLAALAALLLVGALWFWWRWPQREAALVAWIKPLSERIVRWGNKSDFVKLLELLGKFGLVIAAATYLFEIPAQRQAREDALKAKHYQAWAIINSARDLAADGGRRDALQDLNRDGVILANAPLAKAFLITIKLPKAVLFGADLSRANLTLADLRGARLDDATLAGAILTSATMTGADLTRVDLTGAQIDQKQLDEACGSDAKLPTGLTLKPCPPQSPP